MMRIGKWLASAAAAMSLGMASAGAQTPAMDAVKNAPESAWRTVDQENLIYMDLPSGRMLIELRPDFAPKHVEQIRRLTRQGFYNGVTFHRVIEGFMAQGGDPTGTGTGGSTLPDIPAEFLQEARNMNGFTEIGRDPHAARAGFVGPVPAGAQPDSLNEFLVRDGVALWGMHCKGVMSMARADDPNSANSQFFIMFGDNRDNLDQRYTVWGKVVAGFEQARRISRGEPPVRPTPIVRMRVASDVPTVEQDDLRVMRTDSPEFRDYLVKSGKMTSDGYIDDMCAISVPAKLNGEFKF